MKKLICWLTLLCLVLTPTLSALAESAGAHAIESREMTFYFFSPDNSMNLDVYFVDGSDVPYLALSDWPLIMDGPAPADDDAEAPADEAEAPADDADDANDVADDANDVAEDFYQYTPPFVYSMKGNVGTISRPDGYTADFDCDADTIHFLDFDAFMRRFSDTFMMDMLDGMNTVDDAGNIRYFARSTKSYQRYGREVTINAGDYGIDFIAQDGECYVPMQTLGDILLSVNYINLFYNGDFVVVTNAELFGNYGDGPTRLGQMFYSVDTRDRSEAMAQYSYNELCMTLDAFYGLKANHGITSFRELAEETGLAKDLASTDPAKADAALYQLLWLHLDDLHTGFNLPSPMAGIGTDMDYGDAYGDGQSYMRHDLQVSPYTNARSEAYPNGVPPYEEVGNTAYITYDQFLTIREGVDYYQDPPTEEDLYDLDTVGLMIYAYQQITREDSPIENVVMDLSCNGGGEGQAAVFAIASFLGVCSISTRNTLSGALVTGNYLIDLNLDNEINEDDWQLANKNLFCLESPGSFSCGNLLPSVFKASNQVTLLGRTSGGGSCMVLPLSTAYGTSFQISGPTQMSFLKNGAFYDIDQGADPDFPLMRPETFYDREALTEFINGIM